MSRLADVMENHVRLDQLTAILKHHGINAAFVTESLLQTIEQKTDEGEEIAEAERQSFELLMEDLQQYQAHF